MNNSKQAICYIKKKCPLFDNEKIYLPYKHGYGGFSLIVTEGGKLIIEHFYDKEGLDRLIPKLNDYFAGRGWNTMKYYRFYIEDNEPIPGVAQGFEYPSDEISDEALNRMRQRYPDCGIEEVGRPADNIFVNWTGKL